MRFASLVLSACVLTACGGGGGGGGGSQLSAAQAAYESLVLSPGAVYEVVSSLPSDPQQGKPVTGTHYLYDQSTSLPKSPLTNGAQRISVGERSKISLNLDLPSSVQQKWGLFKGTPYKLSEQVREIKYLGGNIVESILTTGGDLISSQTSTTVTTTPLDGTLASTDTSATNIPSNLFTNSILLKPGATWLPGSAYMSAIWNLTTDNYLVYADDNNPNALKLIATGSTIQQLIDAQKLLYGGDFPSVQYGLTNGSIRNANAVSTGVTTYVANSAFPGGFYRTFYELDKNVYVGALQKSGSLISLKNYNTKARESIQAALNF